MDDILARKWWTFTVRGLFALAFAIATWVWPRHALAVLVILFAAFALDEGILALVAARRASRAEKRSWPMVVEGVLGIAVGIFTLLAPAAVASILFVVIAGWALTTGVLEIVAARRLRKRIRGEWLLALSGLLRIGLGAVLLARLSSGPVVLVGWTAGFAFVSAPVLIALSLRLQRHRSPRPVKSWRPSHPGATTGGVHAR